MKTEKESLHRHSAVPRPYKGRTKLLEIPLELRIHAEARAILGIAHRAAGEHLPEVIGIERDRQVRPVQEVRRGLASDAVSGGMEHHIPSVRLQHADVLAGIRPSDGRPVLEIRGLRDACAVQPELVHALQSAGQVRRRGEERRHGRHQRRRQPHRHPSEREGHGRPSPRAHTRRSPRPPRGRPARGRASAIPKS